MSSRPNGNGSPSAYDRNGHYEQIRIKVTPAESDLLGGLLEEKWVPWATTRADLHRYGLQLLLDLHNSNPTAFAEASKRAVALMEGERLQREYEEDVAMLERLEELAKNARSESDRRRVVTWADKAKPLIKNSSVRESFMSLLRAYR